MPPNPAFSGPIEDRFAIRELIDAYADAVTRREAGDWAECWAEDAQWSLPDFPEIDTLCGRPAIVEFWTAAMTQFPGLVFRAWPGSIAIDDCTATVRSYTSETFTQDGSTVTILGAYEDICAKDAGTWKFARREFRRLSPEN